MSQFVRLLAIVAVVAAATVAVFGRDARAHGTLDQSLSGDPGCLDTVVKASASATSLLKQEFVPSQPGLQALDICLVLPSPGNATLNIRAGSIAAPGAILQTLAANAIMSSAHGRIVHFEMPLLLNLTPGNTYTLELTGFPPFSWLGTCAQIAGNCTAVQSPDLYPGGGSNAAAVQDFWFRTYWSTDSDSDGYSDPVDNCPANANPGQENNDRDFTDLHVYGKAFDDLTLVNSDLVGDACDTDDDNDGLADNVEIAVGPGQADHGLCINASADTDPMKLDTDGDRYTDGVECALNTDPASALSKPTAAQCVTASGATSISTDSDADGVKDYVEYCNYGSDLHLANTDALSYIPSDLCSDAKEVASVNNDTTVTSADLGIVAAAFGSSTSGHYVVDFDTNKDGSITSADLGFVASQFGPC